MNLEAVEVQKMVAGGLTGDHFDGLVLSRRLTEYVRAAWPHVEPDPLVWSWHLDAMCEHLEAVTAGEIENLVINVPPGCSKSTTVSVMWQTWEWPRRPDGRWFFASYDQELSTRDSLKCRTLIQSAWYRKRWGHAFHLTGDQNLKTHFSNDRKGWRFASSVGGHGMGEHPDRIVVDDPHNTKGANSEAQRLATREWWQQTMSTRGIARGVRKVIIMQRLHEEDLTAEVLKEGGYVHLMLPMRYEPRRRCVTVRQKADGSLARFEDPRRHAGELLAPERFSEPVVTKLEITLGPYVAASQLQQRPAPAEGGLIKKRWFRFWTPKGSDLPPVRDDEGREYVTQVLPEADRMLQSWDMSVKKVTEAIRKGRDPDPVSGGVWQATGPNCYLLDRVNKRMDIIDSCRAVKDMTRRWPGAVRKLIEDKGNGPAVMQLLRNEVAGLVPVTPKGSKRDRVATSAMSQGDMDARVAGTMVALMSAGNVWVPHPEVYPRVWEYIAQLTTFPNAEHDDDVDMTSQALADLQPWVLREEREAERAAANPPPKDLIEAHNRKLNDWAKRVLKEARHGNGRGENGGGRASGL